MRTKTLLLAAALSAVGLSTSMAQVYSVNAVGFVKIDIPTNGFWIIANPLTASGTGNQVQNLFPNAPDGFTIFRWTGSWDINQFTTILGWDKPTAELKPGEGAFVLNPAKDVPYTVTFVGEVSQGSPLSHAVAKGFSLQASEVPQKGKISADLKYTAANGDTIYRWNRDDSAGHEGEWKNNSYSIFSYLTDLGGWDEEPTLAVGEGFWINTLAATTWSRTFSVNTP